MILDLIFESPPSSVGSSNRSDFGSWEPANLICAGSNNQVINCRRCSIINADDSKIGSAGTDLASKRLNGKFNTHLIGVNNLTSNLVDNTLYVGTNLKNNLGGGWVLNASNQYHNVLVNGDVVSTYTSDLNLKDNILQLTKDKIDRLQPVSFTWRKNRNSDIGLIAQQVREVFPEVIREKKNGTLCVDYYKLVAPLIVSVKQKQKRIDKLQSIINNLKNE